MACLAAKLYDPASISTTSTASLLAMTSVDTTNLRNTFNAPANGTVLVVERTAYKGAVTSPMVLLGVLGNLAGGTGTNVLGRQAPISGGQLSQVAAADLMGLEASFLVTGLTPTTSYSFDAAYGVEIAVASSILAYGGPNDATANTAGGGFYFAVFDTPNLLFGKLYDPSTAASVTLATLSAMAPIDATNLRAQFTTPASGLGSSFVLVRSVMPWVMGAGSAAAPCALGGVMNHTGGTVIARANMIRCRSSNAGATGTDRGVMQFETVVAVTPSTSYDWDLGWGVERTAATNTIKYGGPNDTTTDNAWGGISLEVWGV